MKMITCGFAAACLLAAPAHALQGAKVTSPVELAAAAAQLEPGEWVWAPDIAPEGPVVVYVDLSRQLADIYRNGIRIGVSTISSGKPGYETPTGVFKILQKDKWHHSSTYNNAPMFFQQRLTWGGVALHAGGLPGYPESHGCVHLPYAFAEELFGTTTMGGTIVVQGKAGAPVTIPAAGVLTPVSVEGVAALHRPLEDRQFQWNPTRSPEGPVSIVLSTGDKQMVVIRNGVEIGRSTVDWDGASSGTFLATLTTDEAGKFHYSLLPLPGHDAGEHAVDAAILSRLRMPGQFLDALRGALHHGSHILVTPEPIEPHTTGAELVVAAAHD
ncbi:L,D-transpeptidase family protein [Sphingomicrobium aestuariivivum]|uniref:L,D-transpeptidase family protein n=1 Tax=Sphingomicrobium aestuariivivum TaxID=1582356 RepID=UPI001FD64695|nr:L,D-transpeptidase family protein [Sphingomicrobium aestuariivivum]MCJ8190701.1 L,D-transpeptidase family protein [Sphingomicrobium aestuariivivum]